MYKLEDGLFGFDERLIALLPTNSPLQEENILRTLFRVRTEDDWFVQPLDVLVPLKKTVDGDAKE